MWKADICISSCNTFVQGKIVKKKKETTVLKNIFAACFSTNIFSCL